MIRICIVRFCFFYDGPGRKEIGWRFFVKEEQEQKQEE